MSEQDYADEDMVRYDDRVRPLLLAQAATRDASEWNYEDAEQVIAALLERIDAFEAAEMETKLEEARDILSDLSSYLGAGMGDDTTTLKQFDARIRWGIDHIGSAYRCRAATVVEECSKDRRATWGTVKRAILEDTALPTAQEAKP